MRSASERQVLTGRITRRSALAGLGMAGIAGLLSGCAARLTMPVDATATAAPDLVDLARFDARLRFDIRYATPNNFMGRALYPQAVRRQNICRRSRRKLAECGPRLGVDVKRRACGVASADIRWSVA